MYDNRHTSKIYKAMKKKNVWGSIIKFERKLHMRQSKHLHNLDMQRIGRGALQCVKLLFVTLGNAEYDKVTWRVMHTVKQCTAPTSEAS